MFSIRRASEADCALIRRLERDELLEEFIRFYVVEHDKK